MRGRSGDEAERAEGAEDAGRAERAEDAGRAERAERRKDLMARSHRSVRSGPGRVWGRHRFEDFSEAKNLIWS